VLSSGQGNPIFGKGYTGSWVPVISDAASAGNLGTATVLAATFQRIGNMVFAQASVASIDTTGMTAGNQLFIQGLPFAGNGIFGRQAGSVIAFNIASGAVIACSLAGGATALRLTKSPVADVLVSDVVSGTGSVNFNIAYWA
jgi:hypothetical protein